MSLTWIEQHWHTCRTCKVEFVDTCRWSWYCSESCTPKLSEADDRPCEFCRAEFKAKYLGQTVCWKCLAAVREPSGHLSVAQLMNLSTVMVVAALMEEGYDASATFSGKGYGVVLAVKGDETRRVRPKSGTITKHGRLRFCTSGAEVCGRVGVYFRQLRRVLFYLVDVQGKVVRPYAAEHEQEVISAGGAEEN